MNIIDILTIVILVVFSVAAAGLWVFSVVSLEKYPDPKHPGRKPYPARFGTYLFFIGIIIAETIQLIAR